jgi:A/G-specific adenine glycosylase
MQEFRIYSESGIFVYIVFTIRILMNFTSELINWYQQNKRDLPWRETRDPYKIWISEIILQQTRVAQGLEYYYRFIETFPNVVSLAQAPEDQVLKLWQGLGYYSRARNLHFTAKFIANELQGVFPTNYQQLIKLKGVGEYTAAAIASIAYNEPVAVVDGNVMRFLSRYFGIEEAIDSAKAKKLFRETANELIDIQNPALYNQALMEFGALQCTPRNPVCENCPFRLLCIAFNENKINDLPVKGKKTKISERFFNYLFINHENSFYLSQRKHKDIWLNLYELPLIETDNLLHINELTNTEAWKKIFSDNQIKINWSTEPIVHLLSHQRLNIRFIEIETLKTIPALDCYLKTDFENYHQYAIPKPIANFLEQLFKKTTSNPKFLKDLTLTEISNR